MPHVVGEHRGRRRVGRLRVPRHDVVAALLLLAPHEDAALRPSRRQRVEGRLVGAAVEQLGPRLLLRPADGDRLAANHVSHPRVGVLEVADQDGLGGTDHDAGRLEADVEPMRAEVALFGRVVLGVDEDGVVGAGGDAGLAADADRLVEVDDAVAARVHGRGGAGVGAGRVGALVAARHLEGAPRLGEDPDVDILDVGAGDGQRHLVLRLARRGAGMAADTALVVDDLGPARGHGVGLCGERLCHEYSLQYAVRGLLDHARQCGKPPNVVGVAGWAPRLLAAFVCLYWLLRLAVQLMLFDPGGNRRLAAGRTRVEFGLCRFPGRAPVNAATT